MKPPLEIPVAKIDFHLKFIITLNITALSQTVLDIPQFFLICNMIGLRAADF